MTGRSLPALASTHSFDPHPIAAGTGPPQLMREPPSPGSHPGPAAAVARDSVVAVSTAPAASEPQGAGNSSRATGSSSGDAPVVDRPGGGGSSATAPVPASVGSSQRLAQERAGLAALKAGPGPGAGSDGARGAAASSGAGNAGAANPAAKAIWHSAYFAAAHSPGTPKPAPPVSAPSQPATTPKPRSQASAAHIPPALAAPSASPAPPANGPRPKAAAPASSGPSPTHAATPGPAAAVRSNSQSSPVVPPPAMVAPLGPHAAPTLKALSNSSSSCWLGRLRRAAASAQHSSKAAIGTLQQAAARFGGAMGPAVGTAVQRAQHAAACVKIELARLAAQVSGWASPAYWRALGVGELAGSMSGSIGPACCLVALPCHVECMHCTVGANPAMPAVGAWASPSLLMARAEDCESHGPLRIKRLARPPLLQPSWRPGSHPCCAAWRRWSGGR